MNVVIMIFLLFLIVCAVAVSFNASLINSILIFMVYSVVMSVIWMMLESPDLAMTEAAVGAGITSILFFLALRHIKRLELHRREERANARLGGREDTDADQDETDWETSAEAYMINSGRKRIFERITKRVKDKGEK